MKLLAELPAYPVTINTNTISIACERDVDLLTQSARQFVPTVPKTCIYLRKIRQNKGLNTYRRTGHVRANTEPPMVIANAAGKIHAGGVFAVWGTESALRARAQTRLLQNPYPGPLSPWGTRAAKCTEPPVSFTCSRWESLVMSERSSVKGARDDRR